MIPKIIHYCWFGKNIKPNNVEKCIQSWKKYLKDFEFVEWNEGNFNIHKNTFVFEAYKNRKYAFVSDVARLKALYQFGGFYLDTDVEVLRSFDELTDNQCILGFEEANYIATSFMGCDKEHPLIKEFLDLYENINFVDGNGTFNCVTNVTKLTEILKNKGVKMDGTLQMIDGINVYPQEYFSPYDYINCIDCRTNNTYCIHYFLVSWQSSTVKMKKLFKKIVTKIIGRKRINKLRKLLNEYANH